MCRGRRESEGWPALKFTEEEMRRGLEEMEARVLVTLALRSGDCQSICQGRLFALAVAVKFVLFPILKLIWA